MTNKTGQNSFYDSGQRSTFVLPGEEGDEKYPLKRRDKRTRTSIERTLAFVRIRSNMKSFTQTRFSREYRTRTPVY